MKRENCSQAMRKPNKTTTLRYACQLQKTYGYLNSNGAKNRSGKSVTREWSDRIEVEIVVR